MGVGGAGRSIYFFGVVVRSCCLENNMFKKVDGTHVTINLLVSIIPTFTNIVVISFG